MELKEQLKLARERAKLSVEDVAERLDYSGQAVKNWEAGINEPRSATLKNLENLYDCKLFRTGGPVGDQPYMADISAESVKIVRDLMTLTKTNRHAIVTIIKSLKDHADSAQEGKEPFSELKKSAKKRREYIPRLVTKGELTNGSSNEVTG